MHIIPPLTINAGTHFTYPQRDGGLSQLQPGWARSRYWTQDLLHDSLLLYQLSYLSWISTLTMKLHKCHFFAKEIPSFGHVLSTTGIKPLPSKTAAVNLMNAPKNAKQVSAFLGLVGYYCKLIKNFAHIAKPLTALTHHDVKFAWTQNHLTALNTLKMFH